MRAKRSLGQNFLRDPTVIRKIVDAVDPCADDTVIEIGPGQGALTELLLRRTGTLIAVEFDRDLVAPLRVQFSSFRNFKLVNDDALVVDFAALAPNQTGLKLVANLPYNISTPILQKLMEQRLLFSSLVLMFQREVVERITAAPGGRERGFLSVLVEDAFKTEYLFDVPPKAFHPVPKVWSAVVRLTPKASSVSDSRTFRRLVSAAFSQKRKTIYNNLRTILSDASATLHDARIDPRRRAETLALTEWHALAQAAETSAGS